MFPPRTRKALKLLEQFESRNVTFIASDGTWPIVWEKSRDCFVWDLEGKKHLDLTAAFGVSAAGHSNQRVIRAAVSQLAKLPHAMGDVHPHRLKGELARELSRITFERWAGWRDRKRSGRFEGNTGKTIFCNSGFEAVEAALKTALLATGAPGIIAFEGGYHGLGYGTLNATHRAHFRAPFKSQLKEFAEILPFPKEAEDVAEVRNAIQRLTKRVPIGAVLVEPVQGRGGIRIPPVEFLPMLRRVCDESRALLILDEIFTGFGRTGEWFACEHTRTIPDLICLGKALTGGFPLSACAGRADLMDQAWPRSSGEAIHTSTFLGNPVGCAMALAQLQELRERGLILQSRQQGRFLLNRLKRVKDSPNWQATARGLGLMAGIELVLADGAPATHAVLQVTNEMLHRGFILLPEGEHGNVLSFTPPLTITKRQIDATLDALEDVIGDLASHKAVPLFSPPKARTKRRRRKGITAES